MFTWTRIIEQSFMFLTDTKENILLIARSNESAKWFVAVEIQNQDEKEQKKQEIFLGF